MRAFLKFRTTKTERQLLRMQLANKVIVLDDREDEKTLSSLYFNSLQKLLRYQGDSSAFESEDYKKVIDDLPLAISS